MIQPTVNCLYLGAVSLGLGLLPAMVHHSLWIPWAVYTVCFVFIAGTEVLFLMIDPPLSVTVTPPHYLYVGTTGLLTVRFEIPFLRRKVIRIQTVYDCSDNLLPATTPATLMLSEPTGIVDIPLAPLRRGTALCRTVSIRWNGLADLFTRNNNVTCMYEIPILPNYNFIRSEALRFFGSKEHTSGLKIERFIGEGSEFERLQEYVPGLDHRSIDWKASARHRMLLCREFRAERNHQVIVSIDTGRLMCEPIDGLSKLDHSVHAALLLSYISLKVGDRVGFFAFSDSVKSFLEPRRGSDIFTRLQLAAGSLNYSSTETNFTLGMADLSTRLRHRALIVLFTDFIDTITADLMIESLDRLSKRHLVLFVTLHEPGLTHTTDHFPSSPRIITRSVVASELLQERSIVISRLKRKGIQIIDVSPGRVSSDLINRYLDIKRREMIT